jgi:hypothetical protein
MAMIIASECFGDNRTLFLLDGEKLHVFKELPLVHWMHPGGREVYSWFDFDRLLSATDGERRGALCRSVKNDRVPKSSHRRKTLRQARLVHLKMHKASFHRN